MNEHSQEVPGPDMDKIRNSVRKWGRSSQPHTMEGLLAFVTDSELDSGEREKFIELAIVDDYKNGVKRGNALSIEQLWVKAKAVFSNSDIAIDLVSLRKRLIETELDVSRQTITFESMLLRFPEDSLVREELAEEAKLQSRVTHQSVPAIFSLAESSERDEPVFVEKYINGQSWADLFDTLSFNENISILIRVAGVLAYSHRECHIVHGDVKPENVMIDRQYEEIYVVDWGMAVALEESSDEKDRFLGGTTVYMPPEVAAGQLDHISPATDVFMLGGVLYFIITGKAPYEEAYSNDGPQAARRKARLGEYPKLPEQTVAGKPIAEELAQIVSRSLAFDSDLRYRDAGEFAEAMRLY